MATSRKKKEIQLESMDSDLRNTLWNALDTCYFQDGTNLLYPVERCHHVVMVVQNIWGLFYKFPLDDIRDMRCDSAIDDIKEYFMKHDWNEIYDFIEFLAKTQKPSSSNLEYFTSRCNEVLKQEFSAYRFIDSIITPITSKTEMEEIEETISSKIDSVSNHIETALHLLSDKKSPDYRNSIKESISAVESICKIITGNSDTTMGSALEEIERKGMIELHTDMKDAFKKLYSYTNDASGIRHSLMDTKTGTDFDDAKFMIVSCSAITNYLISKANSVGIKLT